MKALEKIIRRFSLCCFCLGLSSGTLLAQSYAIDWYSIDGGGGTSTGGVYTVSGTIGQPDAGALTGGPYTLIGGFWSIVAAIQNPEGPFLSISQNLASGQVTVSWPLADADGFVLQETSTLNGSPSAPWAQVPFPYQTNANDVFITVPAPVGNKFYRLMK